MSVEKTLNIRVQIQFEDQAVDFYSFTVPIDLQKLRDGKLRIIELVSDSF